MDITYLGHSSFRIRGKTTTLVTDPYNSSIGLKFPKHIEADIITISHDHADHSDVSAVEGAPYIIKGPGEYEIKGIGVVGIPTFHDDQKGEKRGRNTMYRIEVDGISIVHAGDLGHLLSSAQVDELDGVNVLIVPVGGFYSITAAQAVQVINDIEPSIVIPMHYGRPELEPKEFSMLTSLNDFLKEIGKVETVPQAKLTITKDKLPAEMQVVVLE